MSKVSNETELRELVAEWKEFGKYQLGTVNVTIAHPLFDEVLFDVDDEKGEVEPDFKLRIRNSSADWDVGAFADRLQVLSPLLRNKKKMVLDDATVSYKYPISGGRSFAHVFYIVDHWSLSLCGFYDAEKLDSVCWLALENVLANRVTGVAPDCYETGTRCDKSRLDDVEKLAADVIPGIDLGGITLGTLFLDGAYHVAYVTAGGKTNIFLVSSSVLDDSDVIGEMGRLIIEALDGSPIARSVDGIVLSDWKGVTTNLPL